MFKSDFQEKYLPLLPNQPGIYRYYASDRKLLYVGKAKNLKKRVSSYFNKVYTDRKLSRLVENIAFIEWTLTDSEHDAFLLENSLIKHFKPPYNIRLKDDKAYPYLVIKKEHFPRVFLTRQKLKDGSEYLGPFTSVGAVNDMLKVIKSNIPLRTCALPLTPANIKLGKFKACLEYQLGNCNAPCIGMQTEQEYAANIMHIREIFKGNLSEVVAAMKKQIQEHVVHLEFEKAQIIKSKLEHLKEYQVQSSVVNAHIGNLDVASIIIHNDAAYINFMVVVDGRIIHSKNEIYPLEIVDEDPADILSHVVAQLHTLFQPTSNEIVTHLPLQTIDPNILVTMPKSGFKKRLLDLSFKNNEGHIQVQKKKNALVMNDKSAEERMQTLLNLQVALKMNKIPDHIECFDNSNFQGSFPVAAMVCFKDGLPYKDEYRRFHIKTVEGINDFASMSEIVYRRYKRLIDEHAPLPKLVIIDGGKGQLGAAMESIIKLDLQDKMTVVGLAKREELIFFPGKPEPLRFPYNSAELLLIRRVRDEVHRFGITFHRKTRDQGTLKNELEDIPGIGPKTAMSLLQHFRSVKGVKNASLDELAQIVDKNKANIIFQYFKNNK
jgi:excinuclease ABC subunit C